MTDDRTDDQPYFPTDSAIDESTKSRDFSRLGKWLWLVMLAIPIAAALIEFSVLGLARKSFLFYDRDSGLVTIENRMLKKAGRQSSAREIDITRYVEEAILGPISPNSLPLFPKETRLRSLLYRDGVVYADFTEEAALPPPEGGEVYQNFKTLYAGIKRNFPFVEDLRFFIAGEAAYSAEFRQSGELAGSKYLGGLLTIYW
jgi:hypothetical protein